MSADDTRGEPGRLAAAAEDMAEQAERRFREGEAVELTEEELAAIEAKYDEVSMGRVLAPAMQRAVNVVAIVFALYHYYTAGFGTPRLEVHEGWHLAGLFVMIFATFPLLRTKTAQKLIANGWRPGGVPIYDIVLMVLGVTAALWVGLAWHGVAWLDVPEQTFRQGNPTTIDMVLGTALMVLVLEIARRTLGWILPSIICVFIAYALLGPYIPVQILQHPGTNWRQFVNNMYFPAEGIFGVTLEVVSTTVFHFVLFGVIAQRTGLGQLFVDNAMILAGKYTGGPAKVSVISSAFFGTISGSSVANTVSTGSLTIPNMKRLGYPGHFAGGVEAAASAGGQITPPIMGAAAFIMAEFLEVPYTTIVVAALFPALMHYVGVFAIVHFTARRLNLRGLAADALPKAAAVWRDGWANIIPLIALLYVLFSGYTPYMAAFCGISLCVIVGASRLRDPLSWVYPVLFSAFAIYKWLDGVFAPELMALLVAGSWIALLNPQPQTRFGELIDTVATGAKYALAVGAAAAAVGLVIGVINTTGLGFRVSFMVTTGAAQLAGSLYPLFDWGSWAILQVEDLTLFLSLLLIAIACILMGAGIPTTALYIMLATVAQPTLAALGVPPIASHMFVLYYGVVSEITPPVCTSAYAAAAIANAPPFKTGITAFTLGLGKVMAPMAFVYAPVLLIVSSTGFGLGEFLFTAATCLLGVVFLSASVAGFFLQALRGWERPLLAVAGVVLISPDPWTNAVAVLIASPSLVRQATALRGRAPAAA